MGHDETTNDDEWAMKSNVSATWPASGTKRKNTAKVIAIVAAAALLLGGGIASAVAVSNYNAETERLCVLATEAVAEARTTAQTAQQGADEALAAAAGTTLLESESTKYADRAAVQEVEPQGAEGDKPEMESVPTRQSGADFVKDVADAEAELSKAVSALADACEARDDAAAINAQVEAVNGAAKKLDAASTALTEDFALFQSDEAARLAAEKKAADEAAAAEAARKAAEEEAARQTESEEVARRAAEEASWDNDGSGGSNDGGDWDNGGSDSDGSNGGGTIIVPRTAAEGARRTSPSATADPR